MLAEPLAFFLADTWVFTFLAEDPAGDPLDLTGATVTWEVSVRGGAVVFTTTSATITDAVAGAGYFSISAADRVAADPDFAERVYAYQLRVTTTAGRVYVQNAGSLTLSA